jgi:hypothetical protein
VELDSKINNSLIFNLQQVYCLKAVEFCATALSFPSLEINLVACSPNGAHFRFIWQFKIIIQLLPTDFTSLVVLIFRSRYIALQFDIEVLISSIDNFDFVRLLFAH